MIMTFGGATSEAKYFSVDWLSDFSNEREHLFLQNRHEIEITNIKECENGSEFGWILDGLKAMDAFLFEGHYFVDESFIEQRKRLIFIVVKILKHQLSDNVMEHPYEQLLLDTYFQNKTELIINYSVLKRKFHDLFELLCLSEYEWVKLDVLHCIFPKIKKLAVKKVKLCADILKDIV
eukprot:UN05801